MKAPADVVKMVTLMFAIMVVFVTFQAFWIGLLEIPYLFRSLLAVGGGMLFGHATSVLFIFWMKADNSFD